MSYRDCIRTVRATAISADGSTITIPPVFGGSLVRENFILKIGFPIPNPDPTADPAITITDGTNTFAVYNKLSEFVHRSNIVCGHRDCCGELSFHALVSNDPLHIQLRGLFDCKCPNELLLPAVAAETGGVI